MYCSEIFNCLADSNACDRSAYRAAKRIVDPNGKIHAIRFVQNNFHGCAYVRTGLFKKEVAFAASDNAICNLVQRLVDEGWRICQ